MLKLWQQASEFAKKLEIQEKLGAQKLSKVQKMKKLAMLFWLVSVVLPFVCVMVVLASLVWGWIKKYFGIVAGWEIIKSSECNVELLLNFGHVLLLNFPFQISSIWVVWCCSFSMWIGSILSVVLADRNCSIFDWFGIGWFCSAGCRRVVEGKKGDKSKTGGAVNKTHHIKLIWQSSNAPQAKPPAETTIISARGWFKWY